MEFGLCMHTQPTSSGWPSLNVLGHPPTMHPSLCSILYSDICIYARLMFQLFLHVEVHQQASAGLKPQKGSRMPNICRRELIFYHSWGMPTLGLINQPLKWAEWLSQPLRLLRALSMPHVLVALKPHSSQGTSPLPWPSFQTSLPW